MNQFPLRSFPKELSALNTSITPEGAGPMERRAKDSLLEKPTSQTIAVRLPNNLLEGIKELARRKDVGLHNLIKNMLTDQLIEAQKDGQPEGRTEVQAEEQTERQKQG
jgi:hypothetical protein